MRTPLAIVLVLFLLAACTTTPTANVTADERVKVALMLPLTGPNAKAGADSMKGIELALEDIDDTLDIIYEDHVSDNKKAVAIFSKVTDVDGAKFVVTAQSWISNTIYPLAAEKGVWQGATYSSALKRTRDTDTTVSFTTPVVEDSKVLAEFLDRYSSVGVLYMNNDFGKTWYENIKRYLGDKIVAAESFEGADPDVSTQLTKIKATDPDMLLFLSTGKEAGQAAKKARELGITVPFSGSWAVASDDFLTFPEAEGTVFQYPFIDENHALTQRSLQKYGKLPTAYTTEMYEIITSLAMAVEQCGNDPACVKDWYTDRAISGAMGVSQFDSVGNVHRASGFRQATGGTYVIYKGD